MTARAPIQPDCLPRLAHVATVLLMIRSPLMDIAGKEAQATPIAR